MFGTRSAGVAAFICIGLVLVASARPQQRSNETPAGEVKRRLAGVEQALSFNEQALARKLDEEMLFRRLEDLAVVDKIRYTGPPPRVVKNPTAPIDPEGDSEWLVLHAHVRGNVDEVLSAYFFCKKEWITIAPAAKRGMIRFLCWQLYFLHP